MKTIILSLFLLLTVVCLVHTQSCKEKCKGKLNPRECRERCRAARNGTTSDNQGSCKKQCRGKPKPKACLRKCQKCKKLCEGKPDDCLQKCLKVAPEHSEFIIGGQEADVGEWPWQGSLRIKEGDEHFCGAAVISDWWVVTGAHCFEKLKNDSCWGPNLQLVLGLHDQRKMGPDSGIERYELTQVIQHPGFINNNQLLFPNDTAVFHVDRKIDLTHPNIDKIEMAPNDTYDYTGSECWITGWGYTEGPNPPQANILQEAQVNVITQAECKAALGIVGANIKDGHVCTLDVANKAKTGCYRDSGPLQCRRDNKWVLVGVASFIEENCKTDIPNGYSSISFFRDWIFQQTGV